MWTSGLKMVKNGNFWYKFAPKSPYSICTKCCLREGVPGLHFHTEFDHCSFKNVALRSQKSPKMVIFGKNFAPRGKFCRSIGKLEYKCTTTAFLYAMTL